jgi:hypothetical protein
VVGGESPDDAADAMAGSGWHRLEGIEPDGGLSSLAVALGWLRSHGAGHATVALPMPGDPAGLAGPRALTEAAVAAGHAVHVAGVAPADSPGAADGFALVAERRDGAVIWRSYAAIAPPPPMTVIEAQRALRETVLAAAADLAALDVAPFGPDARSSAESTLRAVDPGQLPAGTPAAARHLHVEASRLWLAALVGLDDDGGALTGFVAERRRDLLRALEAAARRALMAAGSARPPA